MTIAEALDSVLNEVDFAAPVEIADVVDVYKRIKKKLPSSALVEGVIRREGVVFEVRNGGEFVRRVKPVVEVP